MMDGEVNFSSVTPTEGVGVAEIGERDVDEVVGQVDPFVAVRADSSSELEDDFEEPDGQRMSLSLDDDGGTHFESTHSLETVIKRNGATRDNAASPTVQEGSDDNDMVFDPAQRLNFDEEEDDDDKEGWNDRPMNYTDNGDSGHQEHMNQRPVVNGSDLDSGSYGGVGLAQDQGQNIRIIEGHDSSLLDDGNLTFGFNFLQTQMIQLPLISPVTSGMGNSTVDNDAHNLYDSLEREDGSSPFGETHHHQHIAENNTSEYFSAGSMTLMAGNSHGADNEVVWAQDDNTDHMGYLSHSQQHLHGYHQGLENPVRHQSPPRNFQADPSSMFLPRKRGGDGGHMGKGDMCGPGDSHCADEDNTDALSLELSEEGLLHNAQMYAQPVSSSNSGASVGDGVGAARGDSTLQFVQPQHLKETSNQRVANINSSSLASQDSIAIAGKGNSLNSQPKNLARNQNLPHKELALGNSIEGGQCDERHAGAGSTTDHNQSASDGNKSGVGAVRKTLAGKVQPRRPAVQGSASSGDTRRTLAVSSRPNVAHVPSGGAGESRKALPPQIGRSGTQGDICRAPSSRQRKKVDGESHKLVSATALHPSSNAQSRQPQGQAVSTSPLTSRTGSHTSLASNISSTNSRVSGVGKESHQLYSRGAGGASQPAVCTTGTHSQKSESGSQTDLYQVTAHSVHTTGSHSGTSQPQLLQTHLPSAGGGVPLQKPHPFQSYTKAQPTVQVHLPQCAPILSVQTHDVQPGQNPGNSSAHCAYQQGRQQQQHEQQHFSNPQPSGPRGQQAYLSQVLSPTGSEGSQHSYNREAVMSQMDVLRRQRLSPNESAGHRVPMDDVQGLEDVRSHLHSMLRIGNDITFPDEATFDFTNTSGEQLLSDQPVNRQLQFDTDSSSCIGANHHDDMSEIWENFPAFSSKMFSDLSAVSGTRSETAVQGEMQYLRDSLEKEKYRRKHCEEHIQKLNAKILEVQQQLAVAVSTDKRKDIMIEQLDKQLARVVEGWKKREAEKNEFLHTMSHEKEQIEETLQKQQAMINNFELDLAQTVEALRAEKEKSAETISSLKSELHEVNGAKAQATEMMEAEKVKFSVMASEWDDLRESANLAEERAQLAQERLVEGQDSWCKKEQDLMAKISEVKDANQRVIDMEKVKLEEQKKKREEAERENEELKTEMKKVILDMEQLIRAKESQKVEMAIMEAKFESSQRKLEADLHTQMEKEIADQASEFHSRMEVAMEEVADRHRKQVAELHKRQQQDTERHMAAMAEDSKRKEDEHRKQMLDLEEKLQESRTENSSLKQSKLKLESQRMEILTKLQFMMQSQWNEAVSLLVSTPQKKSLNSSFMSNQSGGQLASAMAVTDGSTSVTSLNLVTSGGAPPTTTPSRSNALAFSDIWARPAASHSDAPGAEEHRTRELDGMERVEEYLQRLTHDLDVPVTTSDPESSSTTTTMTSNNSRSCNTSGAGQHQHHQPGHHQMSPAGWKPAVDLAQRSSQAPTSTKNPADQSQGYSVQVHGYISSQTGAQTLITTDHHRPPGPSVREEPLHRAVAMRSPQQSASRFYHGNVARSESMPGIPVNHPYPLDSQYHHSYPPLHHQHHEPEHPNQRLVSHPPLHAGSSSPGGFGGNEAHGTGGSDFGKPMDVNFQKFHNTSTNVNVYSSQSPPFTSSPAGSSSFDSQTHMIPSGHVLAEASTTSTSSATTTTVAPLLSPDPGAGLSRLQFSESLAKHPNQARHVVREENVALMSNSLSPPVKQIAEKDRGDSHSEGSYGYPDPNRLEANYSHLSDRMEEHENRQGELEHYVRLLLEKAPGSVCSEPERDLHPEVLESSQDLTMDLDLNDTAQAIELTSQLHRLHDLREQQRQQLPSLLPAHVAVSQSDESVSGHLAGFIGDNGVINSQGLTQISQLLAMYRDQWETNPQIAGQTDFAGQLVRALQDQTAPNRSEQTSRKKDKKPTGAGKTSPMSPQSRKPREVTRVQKSRNGSVSADASLTVDNNSAADKPSGGRNSGGARRGAPGQDGSLKEKKAAGKQIVAKGGGNGGPVWK